MRAVFLPPNVKRRDPLPEVLQLRAALALAGQSVPGFAKASGLDCEVLSVFLAGATRLPWPALAAMRAALPPAIELVLSRDELASMPAERLPLKYGTMLCGARLGTPLASDDPPPWLGLLRAGRALLGLPDLSALSEDITTSGLSIDTLAAIDRGEAPLSGPTYDALRTALHRRGVLFVKGSAAGPGAVMRWPRQRGSAVIFSRGCES